MPLFKPPFNNYLQPIPFPLSGHLCWLWLLLPSPEAHVSRALLLLLPRGPVAAPEGGFSDPSLYAVQWTPILAATTGSQGSMLNSTYFCSCLFIVHTTTSPWRPDVAKNSSLDVVLTHSICHDKQDCSFSTSFLPLQISTSMDAIINIRYTLFLMPA